MRLRSLVLFGFLATGGAGAALAADPVPIVTAPIVVTPVASPSVVANIEMFGGFAHQKMSATEGETCSGCHQSGPGFGGLARAAIGLAGPLTMQLDLWGEHFSGRARFEGEECDDCTWSLGRFGIGTHLTFNPGAMQVGALVSIGRIESDPFAFGGLPDATTFANVAIEAVYNTDSFRIYGQAGYVFPVGPAWFREDWRDAGARYVYARLLGTFYLNPNFGLTANFGVESVRSDYGPVHGLTWGARADYQFEGRALFLFGSYQGGRVRQMEFAQVTVKEHVLRIGIGLNIGSGTLRDRDRDAGLLDFNGVFGTNAAGLGAITFAGPGSI